MRSISGILIAVACVFAAGCGEDSESSGAGTLSEVKDFDIVQSFEEEEEDITQIQSDEDSYTPSFQNVEVVGGEEYLEEEGVDDYYRLCLEEDGAFYNPCEECVCTNCEAYAKACNESEGCLAMLDCASITGCIGPGCLEQCGEAAVPFGGIASKGVDLIMRFQSCAFEFCFNECVAGGGISAGGSSDSEEGGAEEGAPEGQ